MPTTGSRRLLSGTTQAAALMEPLVSRALAKGARKIADLRWRGGIVAGNDIDDEHGGEAAPRAQPRHRLAARERGPLARNRCCAILRRSSAKPG